MSAVPSATRQNFRELPASTLLSTVKAPRYSSIAGEGWDLLTTAFMDAPGRRWAACILLEPPASSLYAPFPLRAQYISPFAGAYMTPNTGTVSSMRAILTVNSPFLFLNSFVPSRGTTHHD